MDDAELVVAARSGDDEAFAALYDRYADRIHDFCCSILHDPHEAADAMQDTFVLAASRLGQLREPAKLRSWLFAIARHEALRHAKARRRSVPTEDIGDSVSVTDADPTAAVSADEARELVAAATAGLADRDRALLDLHLRQGLDGQELADAIGVTPEHAYVLMSRLRSQVERSLGALLVARRGRADCPDLQSVLAEWDGTFSPLWRKRVARHVDGCDLCGERRRQLVEPLRMVAAGAIMAAPTELRAPTLERARAVLAGRSPAPGDTAAVLPEGWRRPSARGGFPPPLYPPRRWREAAMLVVTLAALLLVTGAALILTADTVSEHHVTTNGDAGSTVSTAAPIDGAGTSPDGGPATTSETGAGPGTLVPGGSPAAPTPKTQAPSKLPSQLPADTTAPSVSSVSVRPVIFEQQNGVCQPQTAGVSASVTDDRGVVAVELRWSYSGSSGSTAMSGTGTAFTATGTLGPFATAPQPFTGVIVVVRATDAAGNVGQSSTQATLEDCVI